MKSTPKILMVAACLLTFAVTYSGKSYAQITMTGTVPAAKTIVLIQPFKRGSPTGVVKFKFSAPSGPATYTLGFCIGPAANPCGTINSYAVQVPGGEERLAVVAASLFLTNVLAVGNPTSTPVPFAVAME